MGERYFDALVLEERLLEGEGALPVANGLGLAVGSDAAWIPATVARVDNDNPGHH
jgi:hypothetical protein